jgi:hypothetical protein
VLEGKKQWKYVAITGFFFHYSYLNCAGSFTLLVVLREKVSVRDLPATSSNSRAHLQINTILLMIERCDFSSMKNSLTSDASKRGHYGHQDFKSG